MHGENEREKNTEKRAGNRDDDFIERGNGRELRAIDIGFAFDDVHRRKLRKRDKTAERQRAERILHAVDRFLPERFAEPDAEFLDVESAPARGEKMTELMDDDEQIKKNEDLEEDEDGRGRCSKIMRIGLSRLTRRNAFRFTFHDTCGARFRARPLIGVAISHRDRDAQRRCGDPSLPRPICQMRGNGNPAIEESCDSDFVGGVHDSRQGAAGLRRPGGRG